MLTIHRAERADALLDALLEHLAPPTPDPFTPEVIAVPTRGVERWLTHSIGARIGGSSDGAGDGVCANVEFPFPGRLIGDVLAEATGIDRHEDPWRPERLVWPVLEVLDRCATEPWLTLVGRHIGSQDGGDGHAALRRSRRFAAARHIADLFDRYGIQRPTMIEAWRAGREVVGSPDETWQRMLFERVRDVLGTPSPAERLGDACDRLRVEDLTPWLPDRVSLFGLTRLPGAYLEVLRSLARLRDVRLYALHPSTVLWERIASVDPMPTPGPRADDPTRRLPAHPLLRTWGHDSREMQIVLSAAAEAEVLHQRAIDRQPRTLLERIQHDIRADAAPSVEGSGRFRLRADDRSIQVHACHGRARQVEVLRDAICHLLVEDPSLEPRDVIVMCPDIDDFAPLLQATFGARPEPDDDLGHPDATGLPHLPYRLADRSLRQSNPLLGALADLLDLLDQRLTTTEVLRFAGQVPVRRRFGFDDDDLERLARWAVDSGIRWGLDTVHRQAWQLGQVPDHTWRAGLDRVLLGVTMDTDGARLLGGRLPLDDVDSGEIDLAGRFAELVERIDHLVRSTREPMPLGDWIALLGAATDLLFEPSGTDQWQRALVDAMFREIAGEAGARASRASLSLAEVRALLAGRLRGVPTTADFRTGAITMCTLAPMRAVPHRVVCIVGLDDTAFPRTVHLDGDDLLQHEPRVGDRDPRTEDRQLLLDAILAATDHLVVTYSGRDERTNEPRPPAVPLHELLAVIDRTAEAPGHSTVRDRIEQHHPLQPFDPRAFTGSSPWSFDRTQLAGARALRADRTPARPFLTGDLPPLAEEVVAFEDVVRFVQDPAREFLRQRLGLPVWGRDEATPDSIPIEMDGLASWQIGDHILERLLDGVDLDTAVRAEIGAGTLPPGDLRHAKLGEIANSAAAILDLATTNGAVGPFASLDVDVVVPAEHGAIRVVGTVPGISGPLLAEVSYSRIRPKTRLLLWARLLAATAAHPDTAWETIGIGKHGAGGRLVRHRSLDGTVQDRAATAAQLLARLVDLRSAGLRAPLPLPCDTAEAWASAVAKGKGGQSAAEDRWTDRFGGERSDASIRKLFGPDLSFGDLLALRPTPAEAGPGWSDEPSRFGRLAEHLWGPILARESWR